LEFWCGWWRLIKFLNTEIEKEKLDIKIKYIWVDLSQKLLDFAQKDSKESKKNDKFICQDITIYTKTLKQESLDFVIGIASFQHIPNQKERLFVLKNFYQSLKYNWELIILNRSFSSWFIKKFKQVIKKSVIKTIYTVWTHDWRNLNIPRQKTKQTKHWKLESVFEHSSNNKNHYRFYHIFGIKELSLLWKLSGFKINELTYIDKTGQRTKNRKKSNNTLFIWEKKVF
jgi:2-polyprenyl-3-methyl-5-hydroxy-6-metoxy-1,4-benzoquinol methylase